MKKKIAALLRKWANKLNPQVITCHGEDPRECSYIPIKSVYKITPVQCGYIFPHKFGEIINPNNIPQSQMEWAYRHLDFLTHFTDQELKDELKRRDKERQSQYPSNLHCRDCKYCREGRTFKHHLWTTTVCFAKPKPKMGSERYYATSLSCKICEKFEPK